MVIKESVDEGVSNGLAELCTEDRSPVSDEVAENIRDSDDPEKTVVVDASADTLNDVETVTLRPVEVIGRPLSLEIDCVAEPVDIVGRVDDETVVGRVTTSVTVDRRVLWTVVVTSETVPEVTLVGSDGSVKAPPSLASERVEVELLVAVIEELNVLDPVSEL